MPIDKLFRSMLVGAWVTVTLLFVLAIMPSIGRDATFNQGLNSSWPESSEIERNGRTPHLLVFVHPYCPCTRATLTNLKDHIRSKLLNVTVVQLTSTRFENVYSPISTIEEVVHGRDWNLVFDTDGVEARKFGAITSGECLLFAPSGKLVFSGGVTAIRGHRGPNESLASLIAHIEMLEKNTNHPRMNLLSDKPETNAIANFPIYGCPLFCDDVCR